MYVFKEVIKITRDLLLWQNKKNFHTNFTSKGWVNFDDLAPVWADYKNSKILLGFVISYFF
jgi:hypothetical protein